MEEERNVREKLRVYFSSPIVGEVPAKRAEGGVAQALRVTTFQIFSRTPSRFS